MPFQNAEKTKRAPKPVSRRDLVEVRYQEGEERPYHIHVKHSGALIARLSDEAQIDGFLNRLNEAVFHS